MKLDFIVLLLFAIVVLSKDINQSFSPSNIKRINTIWQECDSGHAISEISIWPNHQTARTVNISSGTVQWIKFEGLIKNIHWRCQGMNKNKSISFELVEQQWLSLLLYVQNKTSSTKSGKVIGKISFNIWNTTSYVSSVPFTSHTQGYACFKIPTILRTQRNTLIAFTQARSPGCDDFDKTQLVYKRSYDDGKTWSPLGKLVGNISDDSGLCGHKLVIGNISPVQLRNSSKYPGRILAPYTRNNFKLWITYSDDDGETWHQSKQIPNVSQTSNYPDCNRNSSYFGLNIDQLKLKNLPDFILFFNQICLIEDAYRKPSWTVKLKAPWEFIAVGPSQGIQMKSGRILLPGYSSPIRGLSGVPGKLPISQLFNDFARSFVLISDNQGETWRRGKQWAIGNGGNEHQVVQLNDGSLLSNSRSFATGSPQYRLQSRSFNEGQSFTSSEYTSIPQPFNGCQGSTIVGDKGKVYVVSPNPKKVNSFVQSLIKTLGCKTILNGREDLSLWVSRNNGKSYELNQVIDAGLSAQSSLLFHQNKLYILHEQSDPDPKNPSGYIETKLIQNLKILLPSRFIYREIIVT